MKKKNRGKRKWSKSKIKDFVKKTIGGIGYGGRGCRCGLGRKRKK
jgi:hypothetical protein